jgi:hypothetical protein
VSPHLWGWNELRRYGRISCDDWLRQFIRACWGAGDFSGSSFSGVDSGKFPLHSSRSRSLDLLPRLRIPTHNLIPHQTNKTSEPIERVAGIGAVHANGGEAVSHDVGRVLRCIRCCNEGVDEGVDDNDSDTCADELGTRVRVPIRRVDEFQASLVTHFLG